jgi:hypothetical protein
MFAISINHNSKRNKLQTSWSVVQSGSVPSLVHLVTSSAQIEDADLVQQLSRLFGLQQFGSDLKIVIPNSKK